MKKVLKNFTKFLFLIYNYEFHTKFINKWNAFYSYWLKNVLFKCGENFNVFSPAFIKGGKYISIGENFSAMNDLRIECWDIYNNKKFTPSLIIGNNVSMNNNIHIGCINEIRIGDNVLFASNIFITDHFHGYISEKDMNIAPSYRDLYSKGKVTIENNVWIGENVTIMPNVVIGKNCIIGANCVVTKSFPPNSIIGGIPAKLIKTL